MAIVKLMRGYRVITDWSDDKQLRERCDNAFSDAELQDFLRTGENEKSVVDLSRDQISQFDGLCQLLCVDLKLSS